MAGHLYVEAVGVAQQWSSWSRWGSWAAVNSLVLKAFHLHFAHLCCCHWKFCREQSKGEGAPFYCFAIIPGELCVCVCVDFYDPNGACSTPDPLPVLSCANPSVFLVPCRKF